MRQIVSLVFLLFFILSFSSCTKNLKSLHWNAFNEYSGTVKKLLDEGADVNALNEYGRTPLMNATMNPYKGDKKHTTLKLLLERGAEVNARSRNGSTALMFASRFGKNNAAQILIANGADVNAIDDDSYTALLFALGAGHTQAAKMLIDKGANINAKTEIGDTALMFAAIGGHAEIAKILIDKGANVNASSRSGGTALIFASNNTHTAVVKMLLDNGANVNAEGANGVTALNTIKKDEGSEEIVSMLKQAGADENILPRNLEWHRSRVKAIIDGKNASMFSGALGLAFLEFFNSEDREQFSPAGITYITFKKYIAENLVADALKKRSSLWL